MKGILHIIFHKQRRCITVAITSAKFTFFGCIPLFNLFLGGFPSGSVVKNPLAMQEMQRLRFDPWDRKIPWRQV